MPVPEGKPDQFLLGSFEFSEPVTCDFTEVILADPEHYVHRISFPGKLSHTPDNLVQLEFCHPRGSEQFESKESFWLEHWVASLRRLGIVQPANKVVDFNLKNFSMICNCYGVEGRPMATVDFSNIPADSNLRPVD